MTVAITPVGKLEQELARASTPKESFDVEAKAKAEAQYHVEQRDFEQAFKKNVIYLKAWCLTTEYIVPTIRTLDMGRPIKRDDVVTLNETYGFTRKQWSRRKAGLAARDMLDEYTDDCIVKGAQPTRHGLRGFGKKIIGDSTGDEWWTPDKYIESVRTVLGEIDLDPASCEEANKVVRAKKIYTEFDSGLEHEWHGRAFTNPPYSANKEFAEKLREEYSVGNITEAIALLGAHAIETKWFAPYWEHVLCFTGHRIRFNTPDGQAVAGNINGSVFIHLGEDSHKFAEEFDKHGYVVRRWP